MYNAEIRREGVDMGLPPHAKFCKNRWKGYTPLGKIYTKNSKFLRLWATSATLGIPQRHKILSQSFKGYCIGPADIALPRGGDAYRFLVSK